MKKIENNLETADYELFAIRGYKYSNYMGKCFTLSGHRGITKCSQELMQFRLKKGQISIVGTNLAIKELTRDFAVIVGKIISVECNDE